MRTYDVGSTVEKGYYLNLKSFELLTIGLEGGVLAGATGGRFVKLPWPLLLVFAPAVGAAFVFFLPAIAFVMVAYYASKALYRLVVRGVLALAPVKVSVQGEAVIPGGGPQDLRQDMSNRRSGEDRAE